MSTLAEGGDETSQSAGFLQLGCTSLEGNDSSSVRVLGLLSVVGGGLCTR